MKSIFEQHQEFMDAVDSQESLEKQNLYTNLIREEYQEFLDAEADKDLVEIADACIDLIYVCLGKLLSHGIPPEIIWNEVHATNMAKVDSKTGKVVRNPETGKIMKPEGWKPPNIKLVLLRWKAACLFVADSSMSASLACRAARTNTLTANTPIPRSQWVDILIAYESFELTSGAYDPILLGEVE